VLTKANISYEVADLPPPISKMSSALSHKCKKANVVGKSALIGAFLTVTLDSSNGEKPTSISGPSPDLHFRWGKLPTWSPDVQLCWTSYL